MHQEVKKCMTIFQGRNSEEQISWQPEEEIKSLHLYSMNAL